MRREDAILGKGGERVHEHDDELVTGDVEVTVEVVQFEYDLGLFGKGGLTDQDEAAEELVHINLAPTLAVEDLEQLLTSNRKANLRGLGLLAADDGGKLDPVHGVFLGHQLRSIPTISNRGKYLSSKICRMEKPA